VGERHDREELGRRRRSKSVGGKELRGGHGWGTACFSSGTIVREEMRSRE
jgi:hypothetical protein